MKRYITKNKTGLRLVHRPCIRVDVAILVGGAREVQLFGLKIKHLSFWKIVNKKTTDFLVIMANKIIGVNLVMVVIMILFILWI